MLATDDRQVVAVQIGKDPDRGAEVVSRCHLDLPVVIRVPPVLEDGTPFPTLYWLTCPLARTRIGRIESGGGVRRVEGKAASDPLFAADLARTNDAYRQERDSLVPAGSDPVPSGGVGGAETGVKCLHAHYAHTRAGGANPVGELVASWVEPLDCAQRCVVDGEPNPDWVNRP